MTPTAAVAQAPSRLLHTKSPRTVDTAIAHGRRRVLERQRSDGSWQERCDMGPFSTAMSLVALHHAGVLTEREHIEGTRRLCSQQRADGSFAGRPFANEGDLSATAACWAALSLTGGTPAARAHAWVEGHGGLGAVLDLAHGGDVAPTLLVMAGLVTASRVASVPLAVFLVPRLAEHVSQRVVFYGITTALCCALIHRGKRHGFLAHFENARAVELLTLYQNRNGSLMNVVFHTALLIPALLAAGVPLEDPRVANAIAWLRSRGATDEQGLFFDVYGSDVWSTASYCRALLVTGASRRDEPLVRALTWLLDQQCLRPHPALTNPRPGAPRTGGWGFQSGEDCYPDCDTTSCVLDVLAHALIPPAGQQPLPPALALRICAAVASARAWLLAMQNPDGGWPSFFHGHPSKRPGPLMLRPMNLRLRELARAEPAAWLRTVAEAAEHVTDASTEDVTARVLVALVRSGTAATAAEARRALQFLSAQQCPTGAWWGRWKVNYLPATACVLSAFAAAGEELAHGPARRGTEWVLAHQNPDGGFGETVGSYRDPSLAGCGESTAPLTGSVLLGLVDAGEARSTAAHRAAEYLVSTQQRDGAWPNGDCVATLVPPNLFYVYGGAARYIPLEALGRFR